jgi:hypothetical protein
MLLLSDISHHTDLLSLSMPVASSSTSSTGSGTGAGTDALRLLPRPQWFRKVAFTIVYCHAILAHCQLNSIVPFVSEVCIIF